MKKRTKLPKIVEKRVFQEANSKCAFCSEKEIAALQIHHIDGDPAHNLIENLLLVCANCHAKITGGVLSTAAVRLKKDQLSMPNKVSSGAITSMEGIRIGKPQFVPRKLNLSDMRMWRP